VVAAWFSGGVMWSGGRVFTVCVGGRARFEEMDGLSFWAELSGWDEESGRAAHDAHISESRYGAPSFVVDRGFLVA
jgi:hypothetical protein